DGADAAQVESAAADGLVRVEDGPAERVEIRGDPVDLGTDDVDDPDPVDRTQIHLAVAHLRLVLQRCEVERGAEAVEVTTGKAVDLRCGKATERGDGLIVQVAGVEPDEVGAVRGDLDVTELEEVVLLAGDPERV